MLQRKILNNYFLRYQSAGSFNSSFFKSSQSAGNYDVKGKPQLQISLTNPIFFFFLPYFFLNSEFCKTLDVKKRQAIEHELRRLRREGDENIAMHARTSVTVKVTITIEITF